jgi:hypothetical protein
MLADARDLVDFAASARNLTNCRIGKACRRRDPGPSTSAPGRRSWPGTGTWGENSPEVSFQASETCTLVKSPQTPA